MIRLCFLVLLLLPTGCQAFVREWQQNRLISHLLQLKSYHGLLRESGVLDSGEDLLSEVWFSRPMKYLVKVTAPEKFAGSTFIYDGSSVYLYFPKTKFAILYRNLPQLSSEEMKTLTAGQFNYDMDHFLYEINGSRQVLGFAAVKLLFQAKTAASLVRSGASEVYDEFSFPLSSELKFAAGQKYRAAFDSVEFNTDISQARFAIPKDHAEILSEWDFAAAGIDEKTASREAGFPFSLSKTVPSGFHLAKIIKQKGPVQAFITIYEKRPYFIYVSSFKDYGFSFVPTGRGIRLKGKTAGSLLPNPHMSSYAFVRNGVQYSVVGNASIEDLVHLAESL